MGTIVKHRSRTMATRRAPARKRVLSPRPKARFHAKVRVAHSRVETVDPHPLLAPHVTPELVHRRAMRMAESNARHTQKSDEALAKILEKFQKLTF